MNAAEAAGGWRPSSSLETARLRASMLRAAREFFAAHNVLEVETPALSTAAGSDPQIESVSATLSADPRHSYFLHTSPEFAMKRLLCAGWPDIFQVCRVYRDGEIGARHQPEFTMVEWYRRAIDLNGMMQHTVQFIAGLLDRVNPLREAAYLTYRDAFHQHAGVDPLSDSVSRLSAASDADPALVSTLGDDRDAWLDLLLTSRVAPQFAKDRLTVLHHYPASQAALARLCPDDEAVADRFEVFLGELELANGYFELTDASQQRARCARDQALRRQRQQPERPLDEKFLSALEHGLPSCCGVAVGFDRLVMLNAGADSLGAVQTFTAVEQNHV